ncbi:MAG: methylmalonyl-CoA mutase, partial [Anaerolineae bacterium]|nr:methylmalonyl-CoA mutase [Anaerolineae bacterium]
VGVNKFQTPGEERPVGIFRPDPETYRIQTGRLATLKKERDNAAVDAALDALGDFAAAPAGPATNLMPPIIAAVRAHATLGEICGALRDVWGEYEPPVVI